MMLSDAMLKCKGIRIEVNWNSKESIQYAEKCKEQLENNGFCLLDTLNNICSNKSILIYEKIKG